MNHYCHFILVLFSGQFSDENCTCPVPCDQTMFATSISYASMSNFDVQRFLLSNGTDTLRMRYIDARETRHRMEETNVKEDTQLIEDYDKSIHELLHTIEVYFQSIITRTKQTIQEVLGDLKIRMKFHREKGLGLLHYTTVNEFVRGFDLRDERTFTFVTLNYNEVAGYLRKVLPEIADDSNEERERFTFYQIAMAELFKLKTASHRAIFNMEEVEIAFLTAESLAEYKVTPDNRYDAAYLSKDIIGTESQLEKLESRIGYYKKFVNLYLDDIGILENMLTVAYHNRTFDETYLNITIDKSKDGFIHRVERINYYRYVIRERHARIPQEITQGLIDEFNSANEYVEKTAEETNILINDLMPKLNRADQILFKFDNLTRFGKMYLQGEVNKTDLANMATSSDIEAIRRELTSLTNTIGNDFILIGSKLSTLQGALRTMWTTMLSEHTLFTFYNRVQQDVQAFNADIQAEDGELQDFLEDFLVGFDVQNMGQNPQQLYQIMNADFPNMSIEGQMADIDRKFNPIKGSYIVASDMRQPAAFFETFSILQNSLQSFKDSCKVDASFYR